jgi:hypothetical protein
LPIRLSQDAEGVHRVGKHIIAISLSPETQHHIYYTVRDTDLLSEDSILWALQAILLVLLRHFISAQADARVVGNSGMV